MAEDKSFSALGSLVRHYWKRFAFITISRSVAVAFTASHAWIVAELFTSADDLERAQRFLLALLGTAIAHMLVWSATDLYVSVRINPLISEFKRIAFNTVWSNDYPKFVEHPSGKTAAYVNDMRDHADMLFLASHYAFLPMLASLPVYIALLFRVSGSVAVGYVCFLIIGAVVMIFMSRPVNRRQRVLTDTVGTNSGRVFDSYANFVNVFSFRSQAKEIARNSTEIDGVIRDDVKFSLALTYYWSTASFLVRGLMWPSVLLFSWYQLEQGNIDFPGFVVSVTVLLQFTEGFWEVVHNLGVWVDRSASYREAYNYLFPGRDVVAEYYTGSGEDGSKASSAPVTLHDALELQHLNFAYPDDPDQLVLRDVSLRMAKGEKIGVVGRSGEGKSTLIKILLGFYEPTSGEILIDGNPATGEQLGALQTYVPQDTALFQDTVAYNIGYAADETPSQADIEGAARSANIHDFIVGLPSGYETLVGERGIKLSLGQRQRIAIARAFLKHADLLILDEATSALDSETEALVQEALEHLWQDKTAIIIAHRLATLNNVDRIIVIDGGQIVEAGTKDELLASGGAFAALWQRQRAGMLTEEGQAF